MQLTGRNIIAGGFADGSDGTFEAISAATGEALGPRFQAAGPAEVDRACALAAEAFDAFRETDLETRARFLEVIAAELEALGDDLIVRAMQESGLPRGRLEGERGRTVGQLRMFADVVRRGDWLEARIDRANPDRRPLPKPDLRLRMVPLGPVVVFGASNFPLAFSVAGGDTAAAFAAGCPVLIKGHPAHPGTGEFAGLAVQRAVEKLGLHPGVFALLNGPSNALGEALVADPRVKAVGFTGSRGGGLALMRIAAARPEPIPVYAEMSSVNPVFLGPRALAERAEAIAEGFVGSLTLGAGQFCTNPGLVFGLDGPDLDRFVAAASAKLKTAPAAVMLTGGIKRAYEAGCALLAEHPSVRERARGEKPSDSNLASARLYETSAAALAADAALEREVFGASSLVVRCPDVDAMVHLAGKLEGQLTASLHMEAADLDWARKLIPTLERKVGRILANGWPTGVEVGHAMVHGGPFPATSDGRSTSVGSLSIQRFLRPVCYQDLPDALLPAALKEANPLRLSQRIDGVLHHP